MNSSDIDYSIFYRSKFETTDDFKASKNYDLFISAYNDSHRVRKVFSDVISGEKHWIVFPQYFYKPEELPVITSKSEKIFCFDENLSEGQLIRNYRDQSKVDFENGGEICIDITGFIRPHLIFLVRFLSTMNIKNIDFIYSDPIKYVKKEETTFSLDYIKVRQVDGCQGTGHNPETNNDYLIIASGYDNQRITDISKAKANSKKVQIFGFPSLQPDMYQENILKAYKAEEATSNGRESFIDPNSTLFAPASDPFITAKILKDFVQQENSREKLTNLYLCPLSTKAQTLGMALYFIADCSNSNVSIIFPICDRYSRETTEGIGKIWRYTVEFQYLK